MRDGFLDFGLIAEAEFIRSRRKFIDHGALVDLDEDLGPRLSLPDDHPDKLTFGQAIRYQIARNQDVALSAYLRDSSNG